MAMQVKFPFGRTVSILVTHVEEASGNFFVQINAEAGKLDALMVEIEENVLSGKARPPKVSDIMVGCIYLAQYKEDNRWYRARILRVNPADQQCEVFFLDYGNTDFAPLSCIRIAEEKFCDLPPQCFECELEGVDLRRESFDETVTWLNKTILEQELYCKAVQLKKQNILVTQLFFDERGTKSVFDEMQSGGLSTAAAVPLTNGDSKLPQQPNLRREVKYNSISLPPDSYNDLSVTWVEDPSHFWCQLLGNTDLLEKLMDDLAEVYTYQDPATLPLQSCTVGYPCCAKFYEDDTWYRGIITNVSSIATGQIEVRFVDYGNTQQTELSDVRDLKDDFLKIPCQALNFAIAGVEPASKDGLWADEAKVLFEKLIKFKHVVGLVTSVENSGKHRVKLIDTTSDSDMELNQILIAANFGIKSADLPCATTSAATASQTTVKKMSPPVFAQENVPVGVEEKALVTNIINPSKFYCQLFKNGPKLESLMQEVNRHYAKLGANEELLSSPSPGDPCCAQFSEDGCWYRGLVLGTQPKGVTVQYVDYGNSETLPINKIKKLIPKFSDLPQQGIECSLNRIMPKFVSGELKWRHQDSQKLIDLALEKEGMLTTITQDSKGICRVELLVKNRRENQNISDQLVLSGNAEFADGALPTSENWNNLKSQTIPAPDLKVGQFEDVIVSYIEHPCNFWCQLQKSATELESLMREISEVYGSEGQRIAISKPVCDMLCCAQFSEDNKWYRGKITGIMKGGRVEVHFVDYGNFEKLPLSRVKKLQTEFLKLPTQAVKCALAKISPSHQDLLSDDVMSRFEELTLDKELVMMADKYDEMNGVFLVVLLDTTEGKNLDVGNDLQTIMTPSSNREEAHIAALQVQPGTSERVFVSSVSSSSKFFCQLLKSSEPLDVLMNDMFEHYESLGAQQENMLKPSVGEFCAAKFTLDDGWYRAKVLDVNGSNVSVLYIDYGNSETLSSSRLKLLNSKFYHLAAQAIECSLSGTFRESSDKIFLELVSEKEFTARIVNVRSGVAEVDLISKDTNQSVSSIYVNSSPTSPSSSISQMHWKPGNTVHVVIPYAESTQKFFCHSTAHSTELDDLMTKLEECYSSSVENISSLNVGSLYVAWYDGWYRAKVEKIQGKDVTVNFIDYGDSATILLDNIRTIKPEFSTLPAQAIPCCLKGSSANQEPENFKELVGEQEFKAQVISAKGNSVYEVILVPLDGSAPLGQLLSKEPQSSASLTLSVPNLKLKHGDKVDVFIPFVVSAQEFYCQLSQNESDLSDLMNKLEEHYSLDHENFNSIGVGAFCVARYEDGGWYRAQVSQIQVNSVEVFYIDYGDSATIPHSGIRSLKPQFSLLPAQAVSCCLKGFSVQQGPENFKDLVNEQQFKAQVTSVKSENTYEVELMSEDGTSLFTKTPMSGEIETSEPSARVSDIQLNPGVEVDVFIPFVDSAQKFFCQLSQNSSNLDELMIRLEEHYSSNQGNLTSISVGSFCVARYEDGGWYRARVTKAQGNSVEVFYIDYGDAATIPLTSVQSLKTEFASLPAQAVSCCLKGYSANQEPENFKDLVIEQEFKLQVHGSRDPGIYEVELFSEDGSKLFGASTRGEAEKGSVPLMEIKVGSFVELCPTECVNPHLFYCQIATADRKEILSKLMDKLQETSVDSEQQQNLENPTVGLNCTALFPDDDLWYRGRITKVTDDQSVEVFYVDFGNTVTLPLSKVRTGKEELSQLAAQAIQCSLSSISPVSGTEWSDASVERFSSLVMQKQLVGKVIKKGNQEGMEIELFDTSHQSVDINIGGLLVNEGLAVHSATKSVPAAPSMTGSEEFTKPVVNSGEMYDVAISHLLSPGKFYCQLENMKDQLDGMMTDLNDHHFQLAETEGCLVSPLVGQPCVALYGDLWYRAKVQKISVNDITVHYVDYGNDETLKPSSVKQISSMFMKTPEVAIECSLDLKRNEWPEEAIALFERLSTADEQLIIKILGYDSGQYQVKVFDKKARCLSEEVLHLIPGAVQDTQKEKKKRNFEQLPLHPGDVKNAYVVHTESPSDFFIQLSETYPELEQMMAEIAEVYSGLADDLSPGDLVVGHPVCAQFAEDGGWYRGVIQSIPSEYKVEIQYIDYGNSDVIPLSDIRQLSSRFFSLPIQAIHCCLDLPRVESFKERVEDKELKVKFLATERGKWKVSLDDDNGITGSKDEVPKCSDDVFELREFPQLQITQEMEQNVYISHIVSPDEFYVQFATGLDELTALSEKINGFYSFLHPSQNVIKNPTEGMSCCAKFSQDHCWYRSRVKGVALQGVEVEFVDYGNSEFVNPIYVKDVEKEFMQLPQQATLCALDVTKDEWSAEEINIFMSAALDKTFEAKFITQDGPKWRVSLQSGGTSVVDLFISNSAADLQKTKGVSVTGVQMETFLPMDLSLGQIEEVYVSHVTESGDFYVQLSKTSSDLTHIENKIGEIYDQLGPSTDTMEVCFVDSLCCAKYSEDFQWYRACVTKVVSDSKVEVHFVDYGNTDTLPVSAIKQLRPNLLTFPAQAIRCKLEGSKDVWTESDVEQFRANILERPLHMTFTRKEKDTWCVTIQELDMFSTKAKLALKERYTKEGFDIHKREEAYFLFAESPDCFWLQLERTGNALEELMEQISTLSDQELRRSQLQVGLPCLGKYTENDMWHRAEILQVQDDVNVMVSYVDYGNFETVPLDRLRPINDSHLKLPSQAICCRLAEVQGVDPGKITDYLNQQLFDKVVEVEVQKQHADDSYTVKLFTKGESLSVNEQIVRECLGDTSLLEERIFEHSSPQKLISTEERKNFTRPDLQSGSKVPVSFVSAFLPAEMQLLLTERIDERDQMTREITSVYQALNESELTLENPVVGMLCCVPFSDKWCRGEVISTSADNTATVKLVDCGTNEKIPISALKLLKDEFAKRPVFVVESSLANVQPSSDDGQWSPECSNALESLCRSKTLIAEITQVFGEMVEVILNDESGKQVNQSLVDLGFAKLCDIQDDYLREQPGLKWQKLEVGASLDVYLMSVKDLDSIQLQVVDTEEGLEKMMDQLMAVYSNLGETEEVIGNPRVGQVCCAQYSEDLNWYRAVVTCVSPGGVEVKFVDYGNSDVAVMIKQLREEFFLLPVQCIDCGLNGIVSAFEPTSEDIALKLMELYESKELKAEIVNVSGDSVGVNLYNESGESVTDALVKLGFALSQATQQEIARMVSISEDGRIVYNYPESGECLHNVSLVSVKSPNNFWCELTGFRSELKTLSEKIEDFYQSLGENDLRFLCLQVGDTCCAQFTENNKWCRSQVTEVLSEGQVCVCSVDYAKQETLTINRIKKLEAKFAVLPVQALYCSLHGIEPPHKYYGEDWSNDALGRFQELCEGADLNIKIKEQDGSVTHVELLDSAGVSISSQLLSDGLAVVTRSPLMESPVKGIPSLSAEQMKESDQESSEENAFEDAESGLDGVEKLANVASDNEEVRGEIEDEFHDSSDHVVEDASNQVVKGESVLVQEGAPIEVTVEQLVKDEGKAEEGRCESGIPEVLEGKSKESSSPECKEGLERIDKEVAHDVATEMEGSESDEHSQAVLEVVGEKQTEAPVGEQTNESNNSDANGDFRDPGLDVLEKQEKVEDQVTDKMHEDKVETGKELSEGSAEEVLTEGFSEEDISEITGMAEEEATAATMTVDENRTEEERVSSTSPLYSPPSSPAVYIQPGGEVQFTKEKSPAKENQEN
ncbi:Tudor domain-containing protein 1 [Stylophora pistillata]|uniref:Tudor domain-containing protein 1 n=1 Tax=Stylophora pistillata TaxID=50429 RepID=A0A2B4SFT4_STYPI|nr:Tudor domain-containing protein 1 [Stylophora pistillata]